MDITFYFALSYYLFYFRSCKSVSPKGNCYRLLRNGDKVWHCCDNHEEINGSCVFCANGYRSDNGEACRPCLQGFYGRKCGEVCVCEKFQECNHILGCSNMSDAVNAATRLYDLGTPDPFIVSSIQPNKSDGKLNVEMVLIICTVTLSLVLITCMIWFRYYTKQRVSSEIKLRNSLSKSNESNELKADGIYDYIDESKICDLVKLPQIDQTINSKGDQLPNEISYDDESDIDDSNDETDEALGDGYLNPYKTLDMLESSDENHRYSKIEAIEDGKSPDSEKCNTADEKILPLPKTDISNENDPMETSKYISMYELDVCTVDVHRSVSMHETVPDVQPTELNTNGSSSELEIT